MADEVTIDIRVIGSAEAVANTKQVQAANEGLAAQIQRLEETRQKMYAAGVAHRERLDKQVASTFVSAQDRINQAAAASQQAQTHLGAAATQSAHAATAATQQASVAQLPLWQNFTQGIQTGWQQAAANAGAGTAQVGASTTQGLAAALGPQSAAAHAAAAGGSTASGGFWSGFTSAFSSAAHGSGGPAGASGAVSTGMASMLRRGLAGIGIGIGVSQVFGFLKDSVQAYADSEQAQLGFEDAFTRFPKLADTNIQKIRELADARAMLTRYDADATEASFTQLAGLKLTGTQIANLVPLVQDYSAKTGKTLVEGTKDVRQAFLGQSTALQDANISFKATGSAGYDYTRMMTLLNETVGGFAEKDGPRAESALERLSNKWTDLKEVVGEQVSPVFTAVFGFLADNASWLGPIAVGLGAVAVGWGLVSAAVAVSTAVMSVNPIFLIAGAIVGIIAGLLMLKDSWGEIWDWIGKKATWVWDHTLGPVVDGVKWLFSSASDDTPTLAPTVGGTMAIDPTAQGGGGFARGGVLPGYAPGVDSIHARLSPGEGVLVPEVVRAIGPAAIHSANAWGVQQRFAFGGIAGQAPTYAKSPLEQALMKTQWQSVFLPTADGGTAVGGPAPSMGEHSGGGAAAAAPAAVPSGDPVQRWRSLATQALQMTGQYTPGNLDSMMTRLKDESSGDPNIVNNWDRNARNGTPSQGLMQVIQPTFDTYAQPGYDKNLLDPLSNMLASINYATKTYGSLDAAYNRKNKDGSVAGYDSGGWLPPGGIAVSGLDRPEAVLTPDQWDVAARAMERPSGGTTLTIESVVINGVRDAADVIPLMRQHLPQMLVEHDRDRNTKRL